MQAANAVASRHGQLPPLRIAVLGVVAAWAVLFEIPRLVGVIDRDPAATDFRIFYMAAQSGLTWGWSHMYDVARLAQLSGGYGPSDAAITPAHTYQNPPLLAWIVAPLVAFPLPVAVYVWTGANVVALAAACRLVFRESWLVWAVALLASLALWPVAFALERGQVTLIVYALAIGCFAMAAKGHQRRAGVLLGVACLLKPQNIALLPAVLLFCGLPRAAAWWLLTSVDLVAAFALITGPTGIGTYLADLQWSATDPNFISSPLAAQFGINVSLVVSQGAFAVLALAAIWRHRRSLRMAYAIGLVGTLVSAVHIHEYDYIGLVVAGWLVIGEPLSMLEVGWLGVGVVCAQLPAIGVRWPIVLWQTLWLLVLWWRRPAGQDLRPDSTRPVSALATNHMNTDSSTT